MRAVVPILAIAAAPAATVGLASCAQPIVPLETMSVRAVAPGRSVRGASLFGTDVVGLPMGTLLTPDAAPGARLLSLMPQIPSAPGIVAGGAVATALSPDGSTLLLLTSGFNRTFTPGGAFVPEGSNEYVFVYDVSQGDPRQTQVLTLPNSFVGLGFDPHGDRFFASGGPDDVVHEFVHSGPWLEVLPAIPLGHLKSGGLGGLGIEESPFAAGLATTASGSLLVVANHENDSVTLIDTRARAAIAEIPLWPGGGVAGGEFPLGVVVVGEARAFVACQRDRQVVEVDLVTRKVARRIGVGGQPTKLIANRAGTRLFVANANTDSVSVIDVASGAVLSQISTAPPIVASPAQELRGSNPNALALSPDEQTLYVTNGGNNAVAVLALSSRDAGGAGPPTRRPGDPGDRSLLLGLIPTGFYPHAVTTARDGASLYVAYGKSPTGPNPGGPWSDRAGARRSPYLPGVANQFTLQLTGGGLLALPTPSPANLAKLTSQVLLNNRMDAAAGTPPVFQALRGVVKHVIYVVGENRTYDQILGDLEDADGDRHLTHWGEAITPNHHALARGFVTLDRFFDAGGVSGDGWQWTMSGRTTDVAEKAIPVEYGGRGIHSYDWEGGNRNINVGLATVAERIAANPNTPPSPDLLPGNADVGAVDGPAEGGRGFLWDGAITAGLEVRNYGAFLDDSRYALSPGDAAYLAPLRKPAETHLRVAFPTRASLQQATDPYYRGFDMTIADYWREQEWAREFDGYVARGSLPALELVRLPHDHLGNFGRALDGVDTPDSQIADQDYALGLIVERLSQSPFWRDTVVIALEDDAQNGSDHVDSHRSFALFAGGHVRRGAVVSSVYSTPSVLRTIELLLGLPPLAQQDAFAPPMADVLSAELDARPFTAIVPAVLRGTSLPIPQQDGQEGAPPAPRGSRESWSQATAGFDFSHADALPVARFNHELYCALVADAPCATEAPLLACEPVDDDDAPPAPGELMSRRTDDTSVPTRPVRPADDDDD